MNKNLSSGVLFLLQISENNLAKNLLSNSEVKNDRNLKIKS